MWKSIKNKFYIDNSEGNKELNKQVLIIFVSICATVMCTIGVSMAAFVWSDTSEKEQSLIVGDLSLTISSTSSTLGTGLNVPKTDSEANSLTPYTFTITNNGSLSANYTLKIVDDTSAITSDGCSANQIGKSYIGIKVDGGTTLTGLLSNYETIDTGVLAPGKSKTYNVRLWIKSNVPNSVIGKHYHGKILLETTQTEGEDKYVDASGANAPVLAEGMIPVEYNESTDSWVKADTKSEWYNYGEQRWANAVTVTKTNRSTYMNAAAGTTIPMDDINTMWVWIPRFKYKIPSNIGSSSEVATPPEIDVVFETRTNTTGVDEATYRAGITSDGTNTNYYTHPAFRDGSTVYNETPYDIGGWDKELTGIWVGKFETSGTADIPTIKPDVTSLINQNVSTQFLTSLKLAGGTMDSSTGKVTFSGNNTYGLTSSTDTHMMKNTELGMVAILSQSQYGKMGNNDYTGANKEVYINNSSLMYMGRSGGGPGGSTPINETYTDQTSTTQYSSYGFYTYNDYLLNYNTNTKGEKVKGKGTGASTTGTIYGIYDMSGGAFKYTFGNWNGYSGYSSSSNSGFNGSYYTPSGSSKTDGISFPEGKYYDKYTKGTSDSTITKEKAILGDATWETARWYKDYAYFPTANNPFSLRGGYYSNTTSSGVFFSNNQNGTESTLRSFRFVLIP